MSLPLRLTVTALLVSALTAGVAAVPAIRLTSAPAAPRTARAVLAEMTLRQRVGQLFMVGTPATSADPATLSSITRRHVGSVILTGRSFAGVSGPARVAAELQARATRAATDGVRLLVATDQEGGAVQVLHGPGFSEMPTALQQGRWRPSRLRREAGDWAEQLRRAGVNMDLAPVEDTVPGPEAAEHNPPIGVLDREFGYRVSVVTSHGLAFGRGMADHRVVPTVKHFPGLGRVHANPDTTTGVTDRVTTRHDAYLRPFQASIADGVPAVMMSTAYYSRLDRRHLAAFSSFIIRRMLRGDLGFRGVVVSDDLADARQVSPWSHGARAVKFLRAGGDLVLTVDPGSVPAMYGAVLTLATSSSDFRRRVNRSALRVLELKQAAGLL